MMQDSNLRSAFFPGFNFGTNAVAAFDTQAERDIIVDNIYLKMVGEGLSNQPDKADIKSEVEGLIDDLTNGCSANSCPASRTRTVATAACASVLGSAAVTIK